MQHRGEQGQTRLRRSVRRIEMKGGVEVVITCKGYSDAHRHGRAGPVS